MQRLKVAREHIYRFFLSREPHGLTNDFLRSRTLEVLSGMTVR